MTHTGYPSNVLAAEEMQIPPLSEAVIPLFLSGYVPHGGIMIESEDTTVDGLMIARSLPASPSSRLGPFQPLRTMCRVLYTTEEPIHFRRHDRLTTY